MRSILARLRTRLIERLVLYLAQPVRQYKAAESADLQALALALRNGDVVLASGRTRAAAIVRRLTGSCWAHAAMYVGPLEEGPDPRCIVEADFAAGVRVVPLSEFLGQRVLVLRPFGFRPALRHAARLRKSDRFRGGRRQLSGPACEARAFGERFELRPHHRG